MSWNICSAKVDGGLRLGWACFKVSAVSHNVCSARVDAVLRLGWACSKMSALCHNAAAQGWTGGCRGLGGRWESGEVEWKQAALVVDLIRRCLPGDSAESPVFAPLHDAVLGCACL